MKKIIAMLFLTSLVVAACKKEASEMVKCETQTEYNNTNHLISFDFSSDAPDFIDTLNKYPQLQIHRIAIEQNTIAVHCNVFYQGIQILNEGYRLIKNKATGENMVHDSITTYINIDLVPTKSAKESIKIAESVMDYGGSCISYQLGILDINKGINNQVKDYKLVWKVTKSQNAYPHVILDAHTGKTYRKYSGIVE